MPMNTIHIDRTGVAMFVGPLEALILKHIWQGEQYPRRMYDHIRDEYRTKFGTVPTYTIVPAACNELTKDGILLKHGDKMRYWYTPVYPDERTFVTAMLDRIIWQFTTQYPAEVRSVLISMAQGNKHQ